MLQQASMQIDIAQVESPALAVAPQQFLQLVDLLGRRGAVAKLGEDLLQLVLLFWSHHPSPRTASSPMHLRSQRRSRCKLRSNVRRLCLNLAASSSKDSFEL